MKKLTKADIERIQEMVDRLTEQTIFDRYDFCRWADETFPKSTPISISEHLRREAIELVGAVRAGWRENSSERAEIFGEIADCYFLLLHLCHWFGEDIDYLAAAKFQILKGRKWGPVDEAGVSEHVRTETER